MVACHKGSQTKQETEVCISNLGKVVMAVNRHSQDFILLLRILCYRAGVYRIYILSIPPRSLGCNFQKLPLWKKEWQYTASSQDELENTHPSAICTPRPSILPKLRQSLGPQVANFLRGCIFRYIRPLGSVRGCPYIT